MPNCAQLASRVPQQQSWRSAVTRRQLATQPAHAARHERTQSSSIPSRHKWAKAFLPGEVMWLRSLVSGEPTSFRSDSKTSASAASTSAPRIWTYASAPTPTVFTAASVGSASSEPGDGIVEALAGTSSCCAPKSIAPASPTLLTLAEAHDVNATVARASISHQRSTNILSSRARPAPARVWYGV